MALACASHLRRLGAGAPARSFHAHPQGRRGGVPERGREGGGDARRQGGGGGRRRPPEPPPRPHSAAQEARHPLQAEEINFEFRSQVSSWSLEAPSRIQENTVKLICIEVDHFENCLLSLYLPGKMQRKLVSNFP
uniref:Uncharacterized protein n=1 Tax=Oryza nivara TaxID=4536 RepID=A0A0E0IPI9_ORYNI